MHKKTKIYIRSIILLIIAVFIITLAINTVVQREIHLTSRGSNVGWNVSVEKNGWAYYIIPGVQGILGLAFLAFSISSFSEVKK